MLRFLAPLAVVLGALFVVNCGGSGSTPSATPTAAPSTATSVVLSAASGTITLPAVSNGNSGSLAFVGANAAMPSPFPTGGITLATTTSVSPPANASGPTSLRRLPLALTNATGVLYVSFSFSNDTTQAVFTGETLTLGSTMPQNVPYYVELDDITSSPAQYINTYAGPNIVNGNVTFTNSNGFYPAYDPKNHVYSAGQTYLLQFYYIGAGTVPTATPSPNPSASAAPAATATPVAVSTTVPLAPQLVNLPVVIGGFTGSVAVLGGVAPLAPGTGATSQQLTLTAFAQLPVPIPSIGTTKSAFPFYVVGLTATAATTSNSPAISVQLPLSYNLNNQIFAVLCSPGVACTGNPVAITPVTTSNGVSNVNLPAGALTGFTQYATQTQYVVFYSSRATPNGYTVSAAVPAGGTTTIAVPPIAASFGQAGSGTYASALTLGGLSAATTLTVAAQTGLFSGISAIIPNTQTVQYALSITAAPSVTTAALVCPAAGCISVTLPAQAVAAAGTSAKYYVEQCSATACPAAGTTPAPLSLNGTTLTVPAAAIGPVPSLGATPLYLVLYSTAQ